MCLRIYVLVFNFEGKLRGLAFVVVFSILRGSRGGYLGGCFLVVVYGGFLGSFEIVFVFGLFIKDLILVRI